MLFAHTHSRTVSNLIHPGNVETWKPKCLGASSHQLDFQRVTARLVKWTVAQSLITTRKRTWAAALNTVIRMGLTGKVAFKRRFGDKKMVRWRKRRRRREIPGRDNQCNYSKGRGCCVWERVRLVQYDLGILEGRVRENPRDVRGQYYFCSYVVMHFGERSQSFHLFSFLEPLTSVNFFIFHILCIIIFIILCIINMHYYVCNNIIHINIINRYVIIYVLLYNNIIYYYYFMYHRLTMNLRSSCFYP